MHSILAFLVSFYAYSDLPKSFYEHEKKIERRKEGRIKASKGLRKARKKKESKKDKKAVSYKKIRAKKLKQKENRQKKFDSFQAKDLAAESRKQKKAKEFAKKKRRKNNVDWKEQNKEFGIVPPPLKLKKIEE